MSKSKIIEYGELSSTIKENNIIFYHIPKTGGTTLKSYFKNKSNFYELLGHFHWIDFYKLLQDEREEPYFITGHRCMGIDSYLLKRSMYITILRDPIERALSYYKFDYVRGIIDESMSFYNFVKEHALYNVYIQELGEGNLKKSKDFLRDKVAIFGFTERYNDFLKLIAYHLEIEDLSIEKKLINKSKSSINISSEEISMVKLLMKDDYDLFNYAKKLYDRRYTKILQEYQNKNVIVTENNGSFVNNKANILNKKEDSSEKFHILASEYEAKNDLENAEKAYKKFAQLVNDDHLISFFRRNNFDEKYIEYIDKQSKELFKYKTKNKHSGINRYIVQHMNNLLNYKLKNSAYDDISFLLNNYNDLLKDYISSSSLSYFVDNNLYYLANNNEKLKKQLSKLLTYKLQISKDDRVAIFGSKKAANIAYSVCKLLDINVIGFIDDFIEGTLHDLPIISYQKHLSCGNIADVLLLGPCQKNSINLNNKNFLRVIQL